MAAICSESNRQALESLRTTPQMQPVHAVDAHWPMVDLAVEVTLAQQRRLTLVETYVLRAFSEINGVTVSEIEQNLGLDLQIIKTVMMNLKQCRAIEYGTRAAEVDEDLRRVRQELGTVNDTLLASGLTDEQRKVQVARRDLLKAEEEALVENIEENPSSGLVAEECDSHDGRKTGALGRHHQRANRSQDLPLCAVLGDRCSPSIELEISPRTFTPSVHEGPSNWTKSPTHGRWKRNTWKRPQSPVSAGCRGSLAPSPPAVILAEKRSAICFKRRARARRHPRA